MAITFVCPCGQTLEAKDEHVGLEAECPNCHDHSYCWYLPELLGKPQSGSSFPLHIPHAEGVCACNTVCLRYPGNILCYQNWGYADSRYRSFPGASRSVLLLGGYCITTRFHVLLQQAQIGIVENWGEN